jgi:hypothetical protein
MNVRSLLAVALAALASPAASLAAPASRSPALEIGGFLGYETNDFDGIALRADGEMPFGAIAPNVDLSFVGSLGFSHLSFDGRGDVDVNVLKIIPAARFTFELNPQLALFADGGLGLYYASLDAERGGFEGGDDDELSLLMRIGGGAWFRVNETTRIGAAIEFDPYFGDFDETTFIIQAGAMFRL